MLATGSLGELPVLELFFIGSEPEELLPDNASCFGARLRDSETFKAAKGPSRQVHDTPGHVVEDPGIARACCKEL